MPIEWSPLFTGAADVACEDYTENLDGNEGKITATAVLRILWDDRYTLVNDLLTNQREWPFYSTGYTPKAINAAITQGDANFSTADGQFAPPKWAKITVNYGDPKTEPVGSFDIVSESLEPFGDFQRLNYSMFRWGSQTGEPLAPDESPGIIMPKMRFVRKLYKLATVPALALTAFGKCNLAAYTSPIMASLVFDVETLLYSTPQLEKTRTTSGSEGHNLTQQWVYNPTGWNKFLNPRTGNYENIYYVGSSTPFKPYTPINMSSIL